MEISGTVISVLPTKTGKKTNGGEWKKQVYVLKTNGEYFHEWGIGRHLLGSQMYDYWRDPHGFTHEHWTDGDLIDASVPANDVSLFEFGKAQYGPPPPATFGHSMPIEEVNKVRAEVPDLYEGVLKDLAKMQKEMEKEND